MTQPIRPPPPWWPGGGTRAILAAIASLKDEIMALADNITQLQADVAQLTTVDASAEALINGFAAQLVAAVAAAQAAGASPAQLQALTDLSTAIETQSSGLAAAVSANTPTPPAP